jgi:hypothetical protein
MPRNVYRYTISDSVRLADARATLDLALFGAQALHGESRVRLDARYAFDAEKRTLAIDASTDVGECLNQLFVGYLRQEYGDGAFRVERADRLPAAEPAAAAA